MELIHNLSLIILTLIINLSYCNISEEKLEYLRKKYLLRITPGLIEKAGVGDSLNITYSPDKIKQIINDLEFPESYNFFESTNTIPNVKDQKYCGSCWSHSSTTALAYRYKKQKNIEVDLSPQYGLSCYLPDCVSGNVLIDAAMDLVKNGTVTEECFPFQSDDGSYIPTCPLKCADGSERKMYYAKNAYTTLITYYDDDNFYDIIKIILYELVNNGPLPTQIRVYNDFYTWSENKENCKTGVYSYDGRSVYGGGHALVIVGYGKIGDKYYWLCQNSWGSGTCDGGLIKIEMGQIGIERVTFFDPDLREVNSVKKEINLHYESIDEDCFMKVTTNNNDDWEDSVEFTFRVTNSNQNQYLKIQCSDIKSISTKFGNCVYELMKLDVGKYSLVSVESLGNENTFNLDSSFDDLNFTYTSKGICVSTTNNGDTGSPYYTSHSSHIKIIDLSIFIALGLILLL